MILLTDKDIALDKIQHPFIIKSLNKMGMERKYLHVRKAICDKPSADIILICKRLKAFPPQSRTK